MRYSIEIVRSAAKFLDKLARSQPKDAEALEDAIDDLRDDPRPDGCVRLRGYSNVLRVRVGDYRICYRVQDGELLVLVILISTRDNVYEVLRRRLG